MWFDSWAELGRIVLIGALGYIGLIALLRASGKRTLAKMNAFDLVVTVSLGSTLATLLLSKTVTLAEGMTAFAVLIFGQYVIAWLAVRSATFQSLIKAEPTLLLYQGRYLEAALCRERVTKEEVLAAVRAAGMSSLDQVGGVVLETDGSVTVLQRAEGEVYATLSNYRDVAEG